MPFSGIFFLNKHFIHIGFFSTPIVSFIPLLLQIALLRMENRCWMTEAVILNSCCLLKINQHLKYGFTLSR